MKATLILVALATLSCGERQEPASVREPVSLHGTGPITTGAITLPASVSVVALSYAGSGKFAVDVLTERWYGNSQQSLLVHLGPYKGRRLLKVGSPIRLNIQSDGGQWTVAIAAISCCGNPLDASGVGDEVTDQFRPRDSFPTNWEFVHEGIGKFIVRLHFANGASRTVASSLGPYRGQAIVTFGEAVIVVEGGPCFWEVQADGNWSIRRL
jgi:hypothetical protein